MQREPFQDVTGQLAALPKQHPDSAATAKAPGVPATPGQQAAQRKDPAAAGAALTPVSQIHASTSKRTQGATAEAADAAVLSQPATAEALVAGTPSVPVLASATAAAAAAAPDAPAGAHPGPGQSHLAAEEVSQPTPSVLVGFAAGAASPADEPASNTAAAAAAAGGGGGTASLTAVISAEAAAEAAAEAGPGILPGADDSGILQQLSRKRPAPSSEPADSHMQKTPRHSADAAAAAGAGAAGGGARGAGAGASDGPTGTLDVDMAASELAPPVVAAAAAAAAETAAAAAAAGTAAAAIQQEANQGAEGDSMDTQGQQQGEEQETWQMMLWNALSAAAPPTRFACSGSLDSLPLKEPLPFLCPEVSVAGVGRLGLPLSIEQASTLKSVAEQAPHGKGLRTVVDTEVRDALQVDASRVSLGSSWQPVLQQAVAQVAEQLGLADSGTAAAGTAAGTAAAGTAAGTAAAGTAAGTAAAGTAAGTAAAGTAAGTAAAGTAAGTAAGAAAGTAVSVEARLYKLLLYEQGGHFSAHQDTEKERGMIGTLVVQLPCAQGHTGGSLTVRHRGKSHTHNLAQGSDRTLQYAAFFADCEHELSPISSGMRLVLVYNLVWAGPPGEAPRLYKHNPEEQLTKAVHAWEAELTAGGAQQRMAFPLEHQYTEADLSFQQLKGNDLAMARSLSTCPGIDAHLVLVTGTVSDGVTPGSSGGLKRRRDGSSIGEAGGLQTMTEGRNKITRTGFWVAVGGSKFGFGDMDLKDVYEPDGRVLFGSDGEDDESCGDDSGNAGAVVERIYHRALLLMWPRSQSLSYAKRLGLRALLPVLKRRIADAEAQVNTTSSSSSGSGGGSREGMPQQRAGSDRSEAFREISRHVLAALEACVLKVQELLQAQTTAQQQQVAGAVQTASTGVSTSASQQACTVLQHGVRAVQLGVQGSGEALLRLIASIADSQTGLTDVELVQQLGAAAALLDAAAVGPLLQRLVTRSMPTCPSGCISLISCLQGVPDLQQQVASAAVSAAGTTAAAVEQLLALAAAVPDLPRVREQVVEKVVSAMQQDRAAAVKVAAFLVQPQQHEGQLLQQQLLDAACAALRSPAADAPTYQSSSICAMLPVLQALPAMQQQLQTALADGVLTNAGLLAAQTDSSMLQLCGVLLSTEQLREKHFADFAVAVAQRPHNVHLLLQLVHKQLPETAMQQLVDAAIAAMNTTTTLTATESSGDAAAATAAAGDGSSSGVVGGSSGGVSLQVCDWARLVNALRQTPALQQQLRRAVADTVCANRALLAAQSDASMLALSHQLLQDSQLQAAHYEHFAAAAANRPCSEGLLQQLLESFAVQQSAAALECLVAAAADSIRNRGDSWQVVRVVHVVNALEDAPAAQQRVRTAIAEAVISNEELLAAQNHYSMLQLSRILLADPALQAAHYAQFAAAVLQRQDDTYKLLQQLLQPDAAEAACEQLVAAAADALRSRSSEWQLSDAAGLLFVLEAWPVLQQQLKAAVADAMFSKPALLAAQTNSSIQRLSRLLLKTEALQAAHYEQFAAAAAARPNSAGLLESLLKSTHVAASAAAQEQLVAAAAAAIRARSNAWQVYDERPLLSALKGSPTLRQQVESAIAEAVFTQAAIRKAQTDASMIRLSFMLIGNQQLQAYHVHFAAAVARRPDSYELLKGLLQLPHVTAALATSEVQQLVSCQAANLRRLSAVPPFDWCMPEAVVPSSVTDRETVQAFLRGPSQCFNLRGFTSILEARKAASALLGVSSYRNGRPAGYYGGCHTSAYGYTIEATGEGHGRNAFVRIIKTRGWYEIQVVKKERYRKELQSVMALRRTVPAAASNQQQL